MKLKEKRERLLVGLYLIAKQTDLTGYNDLKEIADQIGLERGPGELRSIADGLSAGGYVELSRLLGGGHEGGLQARLNAYGAEAAEELLEEHPEYADIVGIAPATDRYVSFSDNEKDTIAGELVSLRAAVDDSNEGSSDDRLIALSEIAAFEATIIQTHVSSELIERFAKRILAWLAATFSKAVVGEVVKRLIELLLKHVSAA